MREWSYREICGALYVGARSLKGALEIKGSFRQGFRDPQLLCTSKLSLLPVIGLACPWRHGRSTSERTIFQGHTCRYLVETDASLAKILDKKRLY